MTTAKRLKVGLIGYGHAGSTFHAPLILSEPRLELSAVATSRESLVARELPGVGCVPSPAELLADGGLDLIVVASPNETHLALALAALGAGKHVVVDKPLANSSREAAELIVAAARAGRTLSVFQNRRWDGDFLTVKRLIAAGTLGRVEYYEARFDRYRPQIKAGWREEEKAGSGLLHDLGAHLIDQALNLFGSPESVTADIEIQRPGARVDDYFRVTLQYGPMRAVLGASMLAPEPGPKFLVRGDGGTFEKYGLDPQEEALKAGRRPRGSGWGRDLPNNYGTLTSAESARRVETLPGAYQDYYAGLAACLLDGAPVPVAAEDARRSLAVLEAARVSAAERRTVAVETERKSPRRR
jgi:scyllo-inositol 2-dehydrogenase (NADP+)